MAVLYRGYKVNTFCFEEYQENNTEYKCAIRCKLDECNEFTFRYKDSNTYETILLNTKTNICILITPKISEYNMNGQFKMVFEVENQCVSGIRFEHHSTVKGTTFRILNLLTNYLLGTKYIINSKLNRFYILQIENLAHYMRALANLCCRESKKAYKFMVEQAKIEYENLKPLYATMFDMMEIYSPMFKKYIYLMRHSIAFLLI